MTSSVSVSSSGHSPDISTSRHNSSSESDKPRIENASHTSARLGGPATSASTSPSLSAGTMQLSSGLNITKPLLSRNLSLTFSSMSACSSSWAAWNSWSAAACTLPSYFISTLTFSGNLTFGTGKVYDTAGHVTRASGTFTPTRVSSIVVPTVYSGITDLEACPTSNWTGPASPTCSISVGICRLLYTSYLSSLGLPVNAMTVPNITPVPANSPPCGAFVLTPNGFCTNISTHIATTNCDISPDNVQLFYFPEKEPNNNISAPNRIAGPSAPKVVQSLAPGTTLTSPSVYLSFDSIWSYSSQYTYSTCYSYKDGIDLTTLYSSTVDNWHHAVRSDVFLSLDPSDLTSVIIDSPDVSTSSMISALVSGLNYSYWGSVMWRNWFNETLTDVPMKLSEMLHPPAEAYYLNPNQPPGCPASTDKWFTPYEQPECQTIFEGAYKPLVAIPLQVLSLYPEWKPCWGLTLGLGATDPPYALTEASTVDAPASVTRPNIPSPVAPSPSGIAAAPTPEPTSTDSNFGAVGVPSLLSESKGITQVHAPKPKSTGAVPSDTSVLAQSSSDLSAVPPSRDDEPPANDHSMDDHPANASPSKDNSGNDAPMNDAYAEDPPPINSAPSNPNSITPLVGSSHPAASDAAHAATNTAAVAGTDNHPLMNGAKVSPIDPAAIASAIMGGSSGQPENTIAVNHDGASPDDPGNFRSSDPQSDHNDLGNDGGGNAHAPGDSSVRPEVPDDPLDLPHSSQNPSVRPQFVVGAQEKWMTVNGQTFTVVQEPGDPKAIVVNAHVTMSAAGEAKTVDKAVVSAVSGGVAVGSSTILLDALPSPVVNPGSATGEIGPASTDDGDAGDAEYSGAGDSEDPSNSSLVKLGGIIWSGFDGIFPFPAQSASPASSINAGGMTASVNDAGKPQSSGHTGEDSPHTPQLDPDPNGVVEDPGNGSPPVAGSNGNPGNGMTPGSDPTAGVGAGTGNGGENLARSTRTSGGGAINTSGESEGATSVNGQGASNTNSGGAVGTSNGGAVGTSNRGATSMSGGGTYSLSHGGAARTSEPVSTSTARSLRAEARGWSVLSLSWVSVALSAVFWR